jgi:uncharacterized membrane protein YfcA
MPWLPDLPSSTWLLSALAALCVGLAKSGLAGFGMIPILLLADLFPARQSTGMLLLLLIIGDAAAVRAFHRHADWAQIRRLLPPAIVGVVAGWLAMGRLDDAVFRPVIGWIILVLTVLHLSRPVLNRWMETTTHSTAFAWTMGGLGGITTMLANAAGPVMTLFFLAIRFPKMEMVATGAWFFFFINLIKVPFSVHLGLINPSALAFAFVLFPVVVLAVLAGKQILQLIPQKLFEWLALIFALAGSLRLIVS